MIKRGIRKLHSHIKPSYFQFVFLLFVVIMTTLAYFAFLYNRVLNERLLQKQLQDRQLVMARSGAHTIEIYLDSLQEDLSTLSQVSAIQRIDYDETHKVFKDFLSHKASTLILDMGRHDSRDNLVVLENRLGTRDGEGNNFSFRDYANWAKNISNKDKVYISQPFISKAGVSWDQYILVGVTPVYLNNQYNGYIVFAISLDFFTKELVDSLSLYSEGNSLLVNHDGVVIGGDSRLLNKNLIDYAESERWDGYTSFVSGFKNLLNQEEGQAEWEFQYPGEKPKNSLIAYHNVDLANQDYILIVSNSSGFLNNFLSVLFPLDVFSIVILSVSTLICGIFIFLLGNISYRSGYMRGIERAKEEFRAEKKK